MYLMTRRIYTRADDVIQLIKYTSSLVLLIYFISLADRAHDSVVTQTSWNYVHHLIFIKIRTVLINRIRYFCFFQNSRHCVLSLLQILIFRWFVRVWNTTKNTVVIPMYKKCNNYKSIILSATSSVYQVS